VCVLIKGLSVSNISTQIWLIQVVLPTENLFDWGNYIICLISIITEFHWIAESKAVDKEQWNEWMFWPDTLHLCTFQDFRLADNTHDVFLLLEGQLTGPRQWSSFRGMHWPTSTQPANHTLKAAITSKIKHAIKLKTSPARLAQLLQPSLAFCFSLQPMMAHWTVHRHWLQAKTKC